jgi:hypothetical protein
LEVTEFKAVRPFAALRHQGDFGKVKAEELAGERESLPRGRAPHQAVAARGYKNAI